jgi:pilus assembly protein CpaF
MSITEVQRMEGDVITLQELFKFKVEAVTSGRAVMGSLVGSGLRPAFLEKFERRGVRVPTGLEGVSGKRSHLVLQRTPG